MAYLKFTGKKRYTGYDGDELVQVFSGGIITVSDSKAKQLLSDFPEQFEEMKKDDAEKTIEQKNKEEAEVSRKANEKTQQQEAARIAQNKKREEENRNALLKKRRGRPPKKPAEGK